MLHTKVVLRSDDVTLLNVAAQMTPSVDQPLLLHLKFPTMLGGMWSSHSHSDDEDDNFKKVTDQTIPHNSISQAALKQNAQTNLLKGGPDKLSELRDPTSGAIDFSKLRDLDQNRLNDKSLVDLLSEKEQTQLKAWKIMDTMTPQIKTFKEAFEDEKEQMKHN